MKNEPDLSYFELQAYVGTTKHMGGFEATKELIELCHVGKDAVVLDVGCGAGATASYLAKTYGCRVVGVDLREAMVALSAERAQKQGVADLIEFRVADTQELPFDDATFDAVLCESVATFIEDKQRVVDELARVVKPGGCVGLNEEIWLRPPTPEVADRVKAMWPVKSNVPTAEGWRALLESAELQSVLVKAYKVDARREATQVKRYTSGDMFRMFWRTLVLYVKSAEFRAYMKKQRRFPKDVFEHLGYAVLVGRR
ncbi:MAG: class I SAM-dependent methyltransferase [Anaerolineae bacterium]|nr:class I SAM-dependent methyltransferase [Anaerolineae bacterium]